MKECRHRVHPDLNLAPAFALKARTGQIDRTRACRSRYNRTAWLLGGERKQGWGLRAFFSAQRASIREWLSQKGTIVPALKRASRDKDFYFRDLDNGGEGEIRTPDTVARMPHFECGAFNHSATSPGCEGLKARWLRRGGYHGLGGSSSAKSKVFD